MPHIYLFFSWLKEDTDIKLTVLYTMPSGLQNQLPYVIIIRGVDSRLVGDDRSADFRRQTCINIDVWHTRSRSYYHREQVWGQDDSVHEVPK